MASQPTIANPMKTPDRPKYSKVIEPSPAPNAAAFLANLQPLSTPHRPGAPSFLANSPGAWFDSPSAYGQLYDLRSPGGDPVGLFSPFAAKDSRFALEVDPKVPFTMDQEPYQSPRPIFKTQPLNSPGSASKLFLRSARSPSKALALETLDAQHPQLHHPQLGPLTDVLYAGYQMTGGIRSGAGQRDHVAPLFANWPVASSPAAQKTGLEHELQLTPTLDDLSFSKRSAKRKLPFLPPMPDRLGDIPDAVLGNLFSKDTESLGTENQSPTLAPTTGPSGSHRAPHSAPHMQREPSLQSFVEMQPDPSQHMLAPRSLQDRPASRQTGTPRLDMSGTSDSPRVLPVAPKPSPLLNSPSHGNRSGHPSPFEQRLQGEGDAPDAATRQQSIFAAFPHLPCIAERPGLEAMSQEQRPRPAHFSLALNARLTSLPMQSVDQRGGGHPRHLHGTSEGGHARHLHGASESAIGRASSYNTEGGSCVHNDTVSEGGSQGPIADRNPRERWGLNMRQYSSVHDFSGLREQSRSCHNRGSDNIFDNRSRASGGQEQAVAIGYESQDRTDPASRNVAALELCLPGYQGTPLEAPSILWGAYPQRPQRSIGANSEPSCSGRNSVQPAIAPHPQIKAEPLFASVSSAMAAPTGPRSKSTKPRERPLSDVPFSSISSDAPADDGAPDWEEGEGGIGRRLPARNRGTHNKQIKRCNCKRSQCLKLYCDCFADGSYCGSSCTCQQCMNTEHNRDMVLERRDNIKQRNPQAFQRKLTTASDGSTMTRGCNCKKSRCKKGYCECFQAGVPCGEHCRCTECENPKGYFPSEDPFADDKYYFPAMRHPPPANLPPPLSPSALARLAMLGTATLQPDPPTNQLDM